MSGTYNSNAFFSFIIESGKGYIWKHDNDSFPCNFYDEQFNFEFEFIDNQSWQLYRCRDNQR